MKFLSETKYFYHKTYVLKEYLHKLFNNLQEPHHDQNYLSGVRNYTVQ